MTATEATPRKQPGPKRIGEALLVRVPHVLAAELRAAAKRKGITLAEEMRRRLSRPAA